MKLKDLPLFLKVGIRERVQTLVATPAKPCGKSISFSIDERKQLAGSAWGEVPSLEIVNRLITKDKVSAAYLLAGALPVFVTKPEPPITERELLDMWTHDSVSCVMSLNAIYQRHWERAVVIGRKHRPAYDHYVSANPQLFPPTRLKPRMRLHVAGKPEFHYLPPPPRTQAELEAEAEADARAAEEGNQLARMRFGTGAGEIA